MTGAELKNRRILICGAGIAGPTLAYWLHRYGFEPTLVERAPTLRQGGYLIDFWGLGVDVAERMEILPELREQGYEIDEVRLVDEQGDRSGGFNASVFRRLLGDRYLSILRSDLARVIFRSLEGNVRTIFDDTILSLIQDPEGVLVLFENGLPERFDLVVGAGGLHSPVRKIAFGSEGFEKYLGYYTASFSVEGYPHRDARAYVSHSAPGRQVSRYSLRHGRTVFFFVFASKAQLPLGREHLETHKDVLRRMFQHDGWECPEILAALDTCSDLYFDAVSQIRMDRWSQGRVTLLGDACFCPSLLAGQGSALAMAAAYVLAGELKSAGGDHVKAFASYERLFHPFVAKKQRAAARFAGSFAPRTRVGIWFRNAVTRLMSVPVIAYLAMGRMLSDSLKLPTYDRR
jgi:2-polyprenyl-6-methoxyphenol hydroxylase-like FAD-dependent oxidoreductase